MAGSAHLIVMYMARTLRLKLKSQSLGVQSRMRAVVHEAGAVEQDRQRRRLVDGIGDRGVVEHVENAGVTPGVPARAHEQSGIDVGRDDFRAFARHGYRRRAADTLPSRSDQRGLACEAVTQARSPPAFGPGSVAKTGREIGKTT